MSPIARRPCPPPRRRPGKPARLAILSRPDGRAPSIIRAADRREAVPMSLSTEAVLALAPDDASAKAAKGLVAPAKWPTLAFSDEAVWGECQGSGSKPYQTQVDLSGP